MAPTLPTRKSPATNGSERDWTDQVTDLIVSTVDGIRDKTVDPLLKSARAIVYGVVILIVALPVVVLALVMLIRFMDWAIPGDVWIPYLILGVAMVAGGLALWQKRGPA